MLHNTEYLADITEDVIYGALSDAIRLDQSNPFENFTQENRDSYLRLKLRGIYSHKSVDFVQAPLMPFEEIKEI